MTNIFGSLRSGLYKMCIVFPITVAIENLYDMTEPPLHDRITITGSENDSNMGVRGTHKRSVVGDVCRRKQQRRGTEI